MHDWIEAEAAAEKAQQFYDSGQWDKALAALDLALSVNPQQGDWQFGKGLTLDALHRYDEAAAAFEQALKLRGEQPETMLLLGIDLIRSGQAERAVEVLDRLAALDPDAKGVMCHQILAHSRVGNHDKAEEIYYLAQQTHEEPCPLCLDHMAQSLAARQQWDKAAWCWGQVQQIDARYPHVSANLARTCWQQGKLEQAREHYRAQLREDPGDIDTLLECGRLLRVMGLNAEAGEKFRRVIELEPTVAEAYYQLGELSLNSGHLDAAAGELEMVTRLAPDHVGVHLNLATVAMRRGRHDEALRHLIAELDLEGQVGSQVLDVARKLIELDAPAQAVDLLTPLLDGSTDPIFEDEDQLVQALVYRGVGLVLCGDIDLGIRDFRLARQIDPQHGVVLYNLAVAYLDQRHFARAKAVLRRALCCTPGDVDLQRLQLRVQRESIWHRFRGIMGAFLP